MKVLLIYPDIILEGKNWSGYYYHGIGFLAAALKKAGHSVNLLHLTRSLQKEEYQEKISSFDNPGLIGFSLTSNMRPYVEKWIGWTREKIPDAVVICGGVHPTLNPEDTIMTDGVDAICLGEGEEALLELCGKIERGQDLTQIQNIWFKNRNNIYKNNVRLPLKTLDDLPFPDRGIFNYRQLYHEKLNEASVMASRGCPYKCSYCCNEALWNVYGKTANYVRFRSVQNVISELKHIISNYPFIESFAFDDDILPLRIKWFREFAQEYKKEIGLPFTCNIRPNLINKEVVGLLKEAGCWRVHMGIECGNDRIRNDILNRNLSEEQIIRAFSLCRENGIKLYSYNMIGLPEEDMAEILDTVKLNAKISADAHQVSIFYPYKNTRLYDFCHAKGLIGQTDVTDYFKNTKIKFTSLQQKQLLFSVANFRSLVNLYDRLFKLPALLSGISVKVLDKLFCSRIGFNIIEKAVTKIYPGIRNNRLAMFICRPVRRAISMTGSIINNSLFRKVSVKNVIK